MIEKTLELVAEVLQGELHTYEDGYVIDTMDEKLQGFSLYFNPEGLFQDIKSHN